MSKPSWVIHTIPGLGRVLLSEMRTARMLDGRAKPTTLFQRNHDLIFLQRTAKAVTPTLRVAEDAQECIVFGRFKISHAQFDVLSEAMLQRRGAWRVNVSVDGKTFTRQDLQRFVIQRLRAMEVRIDEDEGENELNVFAIDESYYICTPRWKAEEVPGRSLRMIERQGALPPTAAAAMAFLAEPKTGETILDPVCGSGTLLAEAAHMQPGARLIGFDTDAQAVSSAKRNLEFADGARLERKDGAATGLAAGSVDVFLANLPFGKQFGDKAGNAVLYRRLFDEMIRIGKGTTWRAVILTSDDKAVDTAKAGMTGVDFEPRLKVKVRGELARVWIVRPGGAAARSR